MRRGPIAWILVLLVVLATHQAQARIVEETVTLQAEVRDVRGRPVSHSFQVTIYRDIEQKNPLPFMILNHGRAGKLADRARTAVGPYGPNARYFVSLGFVVLLPIRIGYGVTGGPDIEDSGLCYHKVYPPGFEAAAQQSLVAIDYAKHQPYVDAQRGLVVGQSFGGTTAMTLAAKAVPGVLGAVNFAGGGGGRPIDYPGEPCDPAQLRELFAGYGKSARIPTLWVYSENDRYFGNKYPREWFDAFVKAGGTGRFLQLPPYRQDGHPSFTGQPAAWRPTFESFERAVMGK